MSSKQNYSKMVGLFCFIFTRFPWRCKALTFTTYFYIHTIIRNYFVHDFVHFIDKIIIYSILCALNNRKTRKKLPKGHHNLFHYFQKQILAEVLQRSWKIKNNYRRKRKITTGVSHFFLNEVSGWKPAALLKKRLRDSGAGFFLWSLRRF